MTRIIIYCEGPTEETFINRLLVPYMAQKEVFITASSFDGVSKYSLIRRDLRNLCREDRNRIVTTMIDYYGLPDDTPGMDNDAVGDFYDHTCIIESAVEKDIAEPNLHMNLMVHEFEALLFSNPDKFRYCMDEKQVKNLQDVLEQFSNPEAIDHGVDTAPSKRILKICPAYSKIFDGFNIAKNIGIDRMRGECRHFDEWLAWMESTNNK